MRIIFRQLICNNLFIFEFIPWLYKDQILLVTTRILEKIKLGGDLRKLWKRQLLLGGGKTNLTIWSVANHEVGSLHPTIYKVLYIQKGGDCRISEASTVSKLCTLLFTWGLNPRKLTCPVNRSPVFRGKDRLPTIHFQVIFVSFRGKTNPRKIRLAGPYLEDHPS